MGTAVVLDGSDLERQGWMVEGLVQKSSESLFAPFTGNSKSSIVYQENDISAKSWHTIVFDYRGNLSGKAVKGKEQAEGKGEQKKKFSDKLNVEKYRLVVDNGDAFDGVNIGDRTITEHSDSRTGLSDLFIRFKDQALIDAGQGNLLDSNGTAFVATHTIDLDATFDINSLTDIETILKTGSGYTLPATGKRRPMEPFKTEGGKKIWLFVVDTPMAAKLKKSTGYQSLVYNADVRGNNNRAIDGVIGKLGQLLIVEWDSFFGETEGAAGSQWQMNQSEIEIAGLRQYDVVNDAWSGQAAFDPASANINSRGLIMGAGALQLAMGKMPDYKMESFDFGARTESAVEFWTEAKKAKLKAESNGDYKEAKITDIDWGVVAVDVQV